MIASTLSLARLAILTALALALAFILASHVRAQQGPSFAIDAGPDGNDATTVGDIEDCVEVSSGDQFQVDIVVEDIEDLLAWEMYLDYDPDVVIVVNQDVKLFQAANEGSSILDLSDNIPDESGFHAVRAVDSADPQATDSGSGVLARVTFEAVGAGNSDISFGDRDINSDGAIDRATLLRDSNAEPMGDEDGDSFFDGDMTGAQVAVDEDCPAGSVVAEPALTSGTPTPLPTAGGGGGNGGDDDSSFPWAIVAGAVAAGVVVVGGAGAFLMRSRRKTPPPAMTDQP